MLEAFTRRPHICQERVEKENVCAFALMRRHRCPRKRPDDYNVFFSVLILSRAKLAWTPFFNTLTTSHEALVQRHYHSLARLSHSSRARLEQTTAQVSCRPRGNNFVLLTSTRNVNFARTLTTVCFPRFLSSRSLRTKTSRLKLAILGFFVGLVPGRRFCTARTPPHGSFQKFLFVLLN